MFFLVNKLTSFRIKSIKEQQPVNQHLNPIEKLIVESKKSNESIAKTLANSLSYHGRERYLDIIPDFTQSCQFAHIDLISVFETAISQKKKIEKDESKIKQELLKVFLEKLEQRNKDVMYCTPDIRY